MIHSVVFEIDRKAKLQSPRCSRWSMTLNLNVPTGFDLFKELVVAPEGTKYQFWMNKTALKEAAFLRCATFAASYV